MRVIAGKYRGMNLDSPKNKNIRPTSDRIKEDVFNIISPYIAGAVFLDLFSGTGSIAIEAVSRGAERAVLVESSRESLHVIQRNIKKTKNLASFEIFKGGVFKFLQLNKQTYDIIYIDPPYGYGEYERLLNVIAENKILHKCGILAAESGSVDCLKNSYGSLELLKTKEYSSTKLHFYKEGHN